ncbi:NAD-dependent epimerase/dehydratase family protein [Flaviramulus sp. BrNp1-15]|uniref:NAD-dependent epimerase/dehydratase family protein n=1 Tax=Flaviramulus sp. BrNp1-15 TaxID=2916754 RepID=UPI001EE7A2E2|nr:NAD-dependent epimerase/dehydratase family protein [Flaviramulus sp. BrNp1-15]ULC59748.1 NAD-dependent epimerase/dehydratase family protein [Flaviramulus sp. BrNp1-15]
MKTILITGINGFLGSHLASILKIQYKIIGLEFSLNNLNRIYGEDYLVYCSNDKDKVFEENKIFGIIHTATVYKRENTPLREVLNTNVVLPIDLYELAIKNNVEVFLNTDSFFNNPKYNYSFLPEYTLSKKHVIDWLKLIQAKTCKIINMKIYHMYGPNDAISKFVPKMIKFMTDNVPYIDTTYGEQTRDFIYIEDVVSAYSLVLDLFDKEDHNFCEYEVGTGMPLSVKGFLLKIKSITNSNTDLRFGELEYRDNEIMSSRADISKLKSLGWQPKFSTEQGLIKLINDTK